MRPSTVLLSLGLATLTYAQKAPFSSLAAFNKSLPLCAQSVQNQVFAQALGMAPYGCSATMDSTNLVTSTNSTDVLCICTAARVPQAPLGSFTFGATSFESVATAACTKSTSDINKLFAETEMLIELCTGLENGTYAGDLSSKGATQTPAAGKWNHELSIGIHANIEDSSFNGERDIVGDFAFASSRISYTGCSWLGVDYAGNMR